MPKPKLYCDDFLRDPFDIDFDEKHYEEFTDEQLLEAVGSVLVFDVESYINYFLVAFKSVETKRVIYFEDSCERELDLVKLNWMLMHFCIVGFNSKNYDIPIITLALHGYRAPQLKQASFDLIINEMHHGEFAQKYRVTLPAKLNHIDLIEVAPLRASLKLYGGRLHCQRMQELPIPHNKILTQQEAKAVRLYCINDLDITAVLHEELKPAIALREQMSIEYGQDLRSRSDAQLAESVIATELRKQNGWLPKKPEILPGTTYHYPVPPFLEYESPTLQRVLEIVKSASFVVSPEGYIEMPKELDSLAIQFGSCIYRMGIGGLHSSEKCVAHKADADMLLIDKDVASYYPSIILNLELFPRHLGRSFLSVYKDIVRRRLQAKEAGNKIVNESLKITINGSFGKLGNRYSLLYSPDLILQVTVGGQLFLLMLIEMLERIGISVVSANTDGILIKCPRAAYNQMEATVIHWQRVTGFETEETRYKAIYNRDVNNYIAIGEDGKVKVKGCYAEVGSSGKSSLSKNPEHFICNDAVVAFLKAGKPIEQTVRECKDIRRFVTVRQVKGGAEKSGVFLGRAVRWYYSKQIKGDITYRDSGNKVPKSDGAMPLMELPAEFPADVDHARYIAMANDILHDIGYFQAEKQPSLF